MTRYPTSLLIATACGVALAADEAPPPRAVDVAAIVRQLGSVDFAEREAATRRLSTLSVDDVPPELLAALKSDNPEVRDRAARAARALKEHIAAERERAAAARSRSGSGSPGSAGSTCTSPPPPPQTTRPTTCDCGFPPMNSGSGLSRRRR